ncbi:MAG: SxtJ family membrane protein [Candidatus Hodarchaeota archaeon]
MIEEIKNIKSGRRELRKFGITVGIVLGLLGGLFFWRGRDYYSYFLILSAALILLGLTIPILLKPVYKMWMTLAMLMGWVMTRVILSILFYLVITPIGLLAKLLGKNFLELKFNRNADSYWIPKGKVKSERSCYERQF